MTSERKVSIHFHATETGVDMMILENGPNAPAFTVHLTPEHAAYCATRLREEGSKQRRLAKRAARQAAHEVAQ